MVNYIKNIIVYLFIVVAIAALSEILNSSALTTFYATNLVMLLITLLAINTATSSIVLTKLKDIGDAKGFDFSESFDEIKLSIWEQVALIAFSIILSVLNDSKVIQDCLKYHHFIFLSLNTTIFVFAIDILRSTASSIFVIIKHK
jgi:hypothetical protein